MTYCEIAIGHPFHGLYHDGEYGFPLRDDVGLFERLVLEINQAGLSWLTILKKREAFRAAYDRFDVDRVAAYGRKDKARLMRDAGIIRNRLKIDAAIENARRIAALREEHGSFAEWLDAHHPLPKADWVKLFKRTFRFTGGEITGEFLLSTGYLPGAHDPSCPVHRRILALDPPWARAAVPRSATPGPRTAVARRRLASRRRTARSRVAESRHAGARAGAREASRGRTGRRDG